MSRGVLASGGSVQPGEADALMSAAVMAKRADGQWALLGGACGNCGTRMFPLVEACPTCMSDAVAEEIMPNHGTVYSLTVVHVGPEKWLKPMTVGYVDLDNGVRVFAHLTGPVRIGAPVSLSVGPVGRAPDGSTLNNFVFSAGDPA